MRSEGAAIALTGDAGVGKSRLATEASSYASMRGFQHLMGRGQEGGGRPFGPWGEILSRYVSAAPDSASRTWPVRTPLSWPSWRRNYANDC